MTLLAGESQSDAFGPLLQIPTLYLHGQRAMQQQTAAPAIANGPQLRPGWPGAVIQGRGVLDQQIFPRLAAWLASALPMCILDLFITVLRLTEKTVSRFEFTPLRQGLWQRAARILSQTRGNVHQTMGAASVAQFGQRKFHLRPLGGRQ
jgi:hypothetical protein